MYTVYISFQLLRIPANLSKDQCDKSVCVSYVSALRLNMRTTLPEKFLLEKFAVYIQGHAVAWLAGR
jgi:hypothetical protein